ncbi:ComEA family DNA-binding protein [Mangrovihabitans endophyticus]|uniref:ComEA family DNA-binding protein n=1 Tax=Mangrovihabitans endophyticus TaxID=1751298 RepID=UPI00166CFCB9
MRVRPDARRPASAPGVIAAVPVNPPADRDDDDDPWADHAWRAEGDPPAAARLTGEGAFATATGSGRLGPFDPGRRGVRVLAVVSAVVLLAAAMIAWRARPHVEPVAVPPVVAEPAPGASGMPESARPEVVVAVAGKVDHPGLVRLPAGARVADAIAAAGGADAGVDVAMLNLARKVTDGELILVGVTAPPGAPAAAGGAAPDGAMPGGAAPGGPLNLNTATLADLDALPGVGPVLAQRILDARTAGGGFTSVSDLRQVSGIGDARFDQLKDLVTV